jgi:hypothetical protein
MAMSDVLDYDKLVLESLRHIENICVKFALQNYAAAGAVFLAYYTAKLPLRIVAPVVFVLALVFTWAIWHNIARYKLFWKLHRIARDNWLAGQASLRADFRADADCDRYLRMTTLPPVAFLPVIIINLLPAAAAALLVIWRLMQ